MCKDRADFYVTTGRLQNEHFFMEFIVLQHHISGKHIGLRYYNVTCKTVVCGVAINSLK